MRLVILFGLGSCLALAACGGTRPVVLHNADGVIVRCDSALGDQAQQKCIQDFQGQGFERVP